MGCHRPGNLYSTFREALTQPHFGNELLKLISSAIIKFEKNINILSRFVLMPSTRREKVKARRSREMDIIFLLGEKM